MDTQSIKDDLIQYGRFDRIDYIADGLYNGHKNGHSYTITMANTRNGRYTCSWERDDGKQYGSNRHSSPQRAIIGAHFNFAGQDD